LRPVAIEGSAAALHWTSIGRCDMAWEYETLKLNVGGFLLKRQAGR